MLQHQELSVVRCTDHKRIEAEVRNGAAVLSADVQENRASISLIRWAVDIVVPVALLVGCVALEVEVVDLVRKPRFCKVVFVHNGQVRGLSDDH